MHTPSLHALRIIRRTPSRWGRSAALVGTIVVGSLTLAGCEFATDTPLGVSTRSPSVAPGHDISGKVVYPDGTITVTLAPSNAPVTDMHRTRGEAPCDYQRSTATFVCSTTGLPQGLYVVQVTDAKQPGEGTALAQVAITVTSGYAPRITAADGSGETTAGPTTLKLSGWTRQGAVRVTLLDENDRTVFTVSTVPDARGTATLRTPALKPGSYSVEATDGLWKIGGDESLHNGTYCGLLVT